METEIYRIRTEKRTYLSEDSSGENGEEMIEEAPVVPLLPKFLQEEEEIKGLREGVYITSIRTA